MRVYKVKNTNYEIHYSHEKPHERALIEAFSSFVYQPQYTANLVLPCYKDMAIYIKRGKGTEWDYVCDEFLKFVKKTVAEWKAAEEGR